MKKSASVAATAVAAISMVIACGPDQRQARVCVDESNRVVQPEACENPAPRAGGSNFWYYHSGYARSAYPRTGTIVRAGGTAVPAAPVARGGFGTTASGRASAS